MKIRLALACTALLLVLVGGSSRSSAQVVLFDAAHRETAGNADWIIDADVFDDRQEHFPCGVFEDESRPQRFPTPPQETLTADSPEDVWTGAISAFAVDLVKLGYRVESLPPGGAFTYLDAGNPQDLSGYDVVILPEPNSPFTAAETTALRDWVSDGGGLFLITDHQTSDRDCDGFDSPHIGNDLMGVVIAGGNITDAGLFGIVFNVEEIAGLGDEDYWFTDAVDDNTSTDPSDPIIFGPHGDGSGGLGFFGATAMTIDASANPTVRGHVWRSGAPQADLLVTFATASLGMGRIACIGDSSPADDGTGDRGDTLYDGWDLAGGGVANKEIHLNAVHWLVNGDEPVEPDVTPPADIDDLVAMPIGDTRVRLSWTASGDDDRSGRARQYELRRSREPIRTLTQFQAATSVEPVTAPVAAGLTQELVVDGLSPDEPQWFALRVADEVPNWSGLSNPSGATPGPEGAGTGEGADHLVISELQVRGAVDHDDEHVEIHNPTPAAVDLTGLSLQYKSASGTTWLSVALPAVSVPAGGWFLVARAEYTGAVTPDLTQSDFLMSASGGHVFLVDGTAPLSSCSDPAVIDAVGYGGGDCPEGTAAPAPVAGRSLERRPGETDPGCGNGQDTDDNAADFFERSVPDPRNSLSGTELPCGAGGPSLGLVGPSLHLRDDLLIWAWAFGAVDYKIRRAGRPDFLDARPPTHDDDLWSRPVSVTTSDAELPPPGGVFYYWVNATDGGDVESPD
ncbi:MAG: lamin tail domain-containing protein [Acidobacteriota bacterium]